MAMRVWQLGRELKKHRHEAGLTLEQAAKELGCSKGRLIYAEQGKGKRPALEFVRALLDLYGVTDPEQRERLVDLARQSRAKDRWTSYSDLFPVELPTWESEASSLRTYDNVVPGLLQTHGYAAAMFRGGTVRAPEDVARHVEARMARAEILRRDDAPNLWAILDEAALRRMVGGPNVMREQIEHLLDMATLRHVTIQILPFEAGAHAAIDGPFAILHFGPQEQPPIVHTGDMLGSALLERPDGVERYMLTFDQAVMEALPANESVTFMAAILEHLQR